MKVMWSFSAHEDCDRATVIDPGLVESLTEDEDGKATLTMRSGTTISISSDAYTALYVAFSRDWQAPSTSMVDIDKLAD